MLDLILTAPDTDAATTALEKEFGFDAEQASAVTSTQFRMATAGFRTALDAERREIQAALDLLRSGSRPDAL